MRSYQHLSREGREKIAVLRAAGLLRPCRDHFWEALLVHFGLAPQTCGRAALGHELPFAVTRNQVCNAAMNRHSALSVGNAAVSVPSNAPG
jgi:hypothetical protein